MSGPSSLLEHLKPPAPLERREVRLLALFAVLGFTQGWTGAVITHTLPFARETFGLSDARISDILALTRAVALLALLFSWWGDHRGRRGPLLLAFLILPLANLGTALLPTLPAFATLQSVARVGTIALGALAVVVLAEEVNPAVRGYAVGLYVMAGSAGTGFGLLLRQIGETDPEAWRILFGLSAIPILVFPLLVLNLRESRAFRPGLGRPPLAAALRGGHGRYFWPMAGLALALAAFTGPAANFALVRLENDLGWSAGAATALLVGTSTPGVTLGLLAGGRAADIVGRKRTELAAIFIGVSGGYGFYFFEEGWIMGASIFASTLGASAFAPAFTSHRAELFPTAVRATAGAWVNNAGIFGGLVGFLAGRFAIDAWGVPTTIGILGAAVLAAAALVGLLPETRGLSLTEPTGDLPEPPFAAPM